MPGGNEVYDCCGCQRVASPAAPFSGIRLGRGEANPGRLWVAYKGNYRRIRPNAATDSASSLSPDDQLSFGQEDVQTVAAIDNFL